MTNQLYNQILQDPILRDLTRTSIQQWMAATQNMKMDKLLKKEVPLSLMDLYEEKFGGSDLTTKNSSYVDDYKEFLVFLRQLYTMDLENKVTNHKSK